MKHSLTAQLPLAVTRTEPHMADEDPAGGKCAFWQIEPYGNGHVWVGVWTGNGPWARHPAGDVLLGCVEGEYFVEVATPGGVKRVTLGAGAIFVVPQGHWHRVGSENEVKAWGVASEPIEHHQGETPPAD